MDKTEKITTDFLEGARSGILKALREEKDDYVWIKLPGTCSVSGSLNEEEIVMKDLLTVIRETIKQYEKEPKYTGFSERCLFCAFYELLDDVDTCDICPLGNFKEGGCLSWLDVHAEHGWYEYCTKTILSGLRDLEAIVEEIQDEHGSIA